MGLWVWFGLMFLMLWVSDPGFAFAFSGLIAGYYVVLFVGCCFGLAVFCVVVVLG